MLQMRLSLSRVQIVSSTFLYLIRINYSLKKSVTSSRSSSHGRYWILVKCILNEGFIEKSGVIK